MDIAASPSFFLLNEKQSDKNKFKSIRTVDDNDGSWTTVTSRKTKGSKAKVQRSRRVKQQQQQQRKREQGGNKKKQQNANAEEPVKWTVPHKSKGHSAHGKNPQVKTYKQVTAGKPGRSAFQPYGSGDQQGAAEKRRSEVNEEGGNQAKEKLRLKLWNILFRNVCRAVDELYHMCEYETAEAQCNEAIDMLQLCTADFEELKRRIRSQAEFSKKVNVEKSPQKNTRRYPVVAWEIKRSYSERSLPKKTSPEIPETTDARDEVDDEKKCPEPDDSQDERHEDETKESQTKPRTKPAMKSAWNKKLTLCPAGKSKPEVKARTAPAPAVRNDETPETTAVKTPSPPSQQSETKTQEVQKLKSWWKPPSKGFLWSDDVEETKPEPSVDTKPKFAKDLMVRTLHAKLSSPERRKPSPSETRRKQVAKQANAELNRAKLERERQEKLRLQSSRQSQVAKVKQEGLIAQERAFSEKLERAAVIREANLKKVAKKAENESLKVNEVQFINEMTELDRGAQLSERLEKGEKRRLEYIETIREKAEKQAEKAQAQKMRKEVREKQLRDAMQKRHEEAEKRKATALEEQKRRLEEMHTEAGAKVNERRTEMEREREARLLAIKEREERVEQERQKLLQAKSAIGKILQQHPTDVSLAKIHNVCSSLISGSPDNVQPTTAIHSSPKISLKQMKKRARKNKSRIQQLSSQLNFGEEETEQSKRNSKLNRILRNLRNLSIDSLSTKLSSFESSLKELKRLLDGSSLEIARIMANHRNMEVLASFCNKEFAMLYPKEESLVLTLVVALCKLNSDCCTVLSSRSYLFQVIEVSNHFLSKKEYEDKSKGFALDILTKALSVVRYVMFHISQHDNAKVCALAQELGKFCLNSALVVHLVERLKDLRSGGQWLGCSLRVSNSDMTSAKMDVNSSSGDWNNATIKEVRSAIRLLSCGFGLIEALLHVQPRNKSLIQFAKDSSAFHIVSLLVGISFAVAAQQEPRNQTNSEVIAVAKTGLRIFNILAVEDLDYLQKSLGSSNVQFEFQQLLRNVLDLCMTGEADGLPRPPSSSWHSNFQRLTEPSPEDVECLFAELIVLMGFYARGNQQNQESLNWGQAPTPLCRLCSLPFQYFSSATGKEILLPTIVSICFENDRALARASEDCCPSLLSTYLEENLGSEDTEALELRFPLQDCEKGIAYFSNGASR